MFLLKQFLEKSLQHEITTTWKEILFQRFYQSINLKNFTMKIWLVFFINGQYISRSIFDQRHGSRLTGITAANATGVKMPMFAFRQSKSPRRFKEVKHLSCRYKNSNKDWIDKKLLEERIQEIVRKFIAAEKGLSLLQMNALHIQAFIQALFYNR